MKKLKLWPLVAATYFMVAGGPYGLEDLVQGAGYRLAIISLLITPLLWALPAALMVGELSSAIPEEGGYYVWVRRALGPFWGVQEAWLSLAASIFDMAIYPTLFVLYLGQLWPQIKQGHLDTGIAVLVVVGCVGWNLRGAPAVGDSSIVFGLALLAPFAAMCVAAVFEGARSGASGLHNPSLLAGMLVVMWNYMGFDNASTVAAEVERPQRTYPLAMGLTVLLIAATYIAPVAAAARAGIDPSQWTTGSWVTAAQAIGGRALGIGVVVGGMLCGAGMLNALVLSYSRVPMALAEDGYLPRALARRNPKTGAPAWSIVACGIAWCLALGLGFERLVELDVLLYGFSLLLEFVALAVLRVREPELPRGFRVPGGTAGAALIGAPPMALLGIALWKTAGEQGFTRGLAVGLALIAAGPVIYAAAAWRKRSLAAR